MDKIIKYFKIVSSLCKHKWGRHIVIFMYASEVDKQWIFYIINYRRKNSEKNFSSHDSGSDSLKKLPLLPIT